MNDIIRAALAPASGWFLLIEPPVALVLALARQERTWRVTALYQRKGRARRSRDKLASVTSVAGKTSVVVGSVEDLPFAGASFEAVVCASGLPPRTDPIEALRSIRRLARPGGLVLVVSRLRQGTLGGVSSLLRRAVRAGDLPRASDLTGWMLRAGMRSVRQAAVPRSVAARVVTWAQVRRRTWEASAALVTASSRSRSP